LKIVKGFEIKSCASSSLTFSDSVLTSKLLFNDAIPGITDIMWFGNNLNKGLAIISFNNYNLKLLDNHNQALKIIIPVTVTNGEHMFNLLAI